MIYTPVPKLLKPLCYCPIYTILAHNHRIIEKDLASSNDKFSFLFNTFETNFRISRRFLVCKSFKSFGHCKHKLAYILTKKECLLYTTLFLLSSSPFNKSEQLLISFQSWHFFCVIQQKAIMWCNAPAYSLHLPDHGDVDSHLLLVAPLSHCIYIVRKVRTTLNSPKNETHYPDQRRCSGQRVLFIL